MCIYILPEIISYFNFPYSSSDTASHHSFDVSSPGTSTAKCEYSLLSDNIYPTYAVTKKALKASGVKEEKQVNALEEIGCVVLELGYFIDFSGKGLQDPLSVVLSLTGEEQDERVDISINEMLEEYVWSKD